MAASSSFMKLQNTNHGYQPLFETIYQYWLSSAIYVSVVLDIPGFLCHSKKSFEQLFDEIKEKKPNLIKDNLYRIIRSLTAIGVFSKDKQDFFELTEMGQSLLNEDVKFFILDHLSRENWFKICNVGEQKDFSHFDMAFSRKAPSMSDELSQIIFSYQYTKALYLLVKFNIADILNDKSLSILDIAEIVDINITVLEKIFLLLEYKNILHKNIDETYILTITGRFLLTDNTESLKNVVLHENIAKWQAAANLITAITEGLEPFKVTHGKGLFDYLKDLQDESKSEFDIFNQAMAEISTIEIKATVTSLIIPGGARTIMDIGGGTGALMSALLRQHPDLVGTIFDLPETIAQITHTDARCTIHGGNFFEKDTIPYADVILLKRALHDWSDSDAVTILSHCAEKCETIIIIEWLWKETENNMFVSSLDLFLMSIGGKIRSEQAFTELFRAAGIVGSDIKELSPGVSAIYALPHKKLIEIPKDSANAMTRLGIHAKPTLSQKPEVECDEPHHLSGMLRK